MKIREPIQSKSFWMLWGVLVCGMAIWTVIIKQYPFRASSFYLEPSLVSHPTTFAVAIANIYLFVAFFRRTKPNFVRVLIICILTTVISFAAIDRDFELEQVRWEFDGTLERKYRSDNHGQKSIEIGGHDGGHYELVDDSFWEKVQIGDRLVKKPYSVYALLNGEKEIIVQKGLLGKRRGRQLAK